MAPLSPALAPAPRRLLALTLVFGAACRHPNAAPAVPTGALVFYTADDVAVLDLATGADTVVGPLGDRRPQVVVRGDTAWWLRDADALVIQHRDGRTTTTLASEAERQARGDEAERAPRPPSAIAHAEDVSADGRLVLWLDDDMDARGDTHAVTVAIAPVDDVAAPRTVRLEGRRGADCRFAGAAAPTVVCVAPPDGPGARALVAVVPGRAPRVLLGGLLSPDLVPSPDGRFVAVRRPTAAGDQLVVVTIATGVARDVGRPGPLRSPVAWLVGRAPGP